MTESTMNAQNTNAQQCHAAIVLLMDQSGSISNENFAVQVRGTAEAITSPEILRIIHQQGPIAFQAMSFNAGIHPFAEWTLIRNEQDAKELSADISEHAARGTGGSTQMSIALAAAIQELHSPEKEAICPHGRNIIDISTDANADDPRQTKTESMRAFDAFMTINGVAVDGDEVHRDATVALLRENVITPDGRVFETDWKNYGNVIRQKLSWELSDASSAAQPPSTRRSSTPAR